LHASLKSKDGFMHWQFEQYESSLRRTANRPIGVSHRSLNEVDQREQLCSISDAANLCGLGDVLFALTYVNGAHRSA